MAITIEDNIKGFDNLLEQIDAAGNEIQRERGTLFERLVLGYLKKEPTYQRLFKNVWLLNEVPTEYSIPKKDTGVDLVAERMNGDLVAIQAKYYKDKIGKAEINSFVAEMGKRYYKMGMIVSTVDEWNANARETIEENEKIIEIIGLTNLRNSQINWSEFDFSRPEAVTIQQPKKLRFYQKTALKNALEHYKDHDRGQLIMAPGTGKTFTSLKIAESMAENDRKQFKVLYLVPSIQLLTQTLRGWNNDTKFKMASLAVTSDRDASRGTDNTEDIKATDIGYPATTDKEKLLENWADIQQNEADAEMMVVFSTYHSIGVISDAQKDGFPDFDFIIADEAHRTTGALVAGKDESHFTKVHDNNIVKGAKRLYQTATPKIYGDSAKKTAKDKSILLSSMDDESKYGEVIYRMGFGQAVTHDILSDYKVMVLAVDERAIQKDMQKSLSDPENGLNIDDIGRIIGIWNGMMRRNGFKNPVKNSPFDGAPLERAIAFTKSIADSKKVTQQFEEVVNDYLGNKMDEESVHLSMRHADGSMNALEKGDVLDWLADPEKPSNEARIVSNVRFLTEGIDVPSLDAIIFLSPKKSQVDIVQAVGRIMRKSKNKDYGYIILPIVIPQGETPETILDNNKNYEAIWQVINALRSVDERFEAMIDKLNIAKPKQLKVIGVGQAPDSANNESNNNFDNSYDDEKVQGTLEYQWDKFEAAIYGKIVEKVGDRKYLENWSADVAKIAQRQISWMKTRLEDKNDPITVEFKKFIISLQHNINEDIDEDKAIEMLSQHLITKPIFEALFEEYSFVNNNPVSAAMENIVRELEKAGFAKEQEELSPLYESVKMRAEGVEKAEDKQNIIITLYDKFFSTAFKSTTERLGIVFTPLEVVDFIVKSVDDVLKQHFGKSIASKGVHILDPFTGTGTFVVRTLHYLKDLMNKDEITLADIARKYTQELHANEIILLSYYIAAINIEATFDEINGNKGYAPFEGIVLTDTFESTEAEDTLDDTYFGSNNDRLKRQKEVPITAIIGNPPYSAGQSSVNDNNQKTDYHNLNSRIEKTYAKYSKSNLKKSLYDSYIQAFRWASDRIEHNGVVGFVTNGSFIDSHSTDGFRKVLAEDFNFLYIYNLRGDQRTQGEISRKEGGKIFGSGSRTPIAISILVKDGSDNHEIHYRDIGDYLSRDEKLEIIKNASSINNITWTSVNPDKNNDWINQRDENYESFLPMYDNKDMDNSIYLNQLTGLYSGRDAWVSGFSKNRTLRNAKNLVENYSYELERLSKIVDTKERISQVNKDEKFISWTTGLTSSFAKGKSLNIDEDRVLQYMHRPFTKKWVLFDKEILERPSRYYDIVGKTGKNIYIQGQGMNKPFSALITEFVPNLQYNGNGKGFPMYSGEDNLGKINNISESFKKKINLDADDIVYYIYAVLNSKEYLNKYASDLKKAFPRIPILKNKEKYVEIGKALADLHLNYEYQPNWDGVEAIISNDNPSYKVEKMKHPKKGVLDTIIYNHDITIQNIPEKAYKYIVNGRPAIEWIIDQYQVKTDKKSGIVDDPNEFSDNPKYILNLLLSVITVSMKTLELIEQLPPFEVIED